MKKRRKQLIFSSLMAMVLLLNGLFWVSAEDGESGEWKSAPIIPDHVSQATIEIFLKGQALGNYANRYSKAADCNGSPSLFLGHFGYPEDVWSLGEYEYLRPVIVEYHDSLQHTSEASMKGFNAASLLTPFLANPEVCESGDSPLVCEIKTYQPSVMFIFMGTNDAYRQETFEENMRTVIETMIEYGVIPIVASKPDDLLGTNDAFNTILFNLANEYDVPFWNFWAAVQDLPNQGMDTEEPGHITFAPPNFDDEWNMTAAWPYRNLGALEILALLQSELPIAE